MSEPLLYFAFGSNLYGPQMEERCPDSSVFEPGLLDDYRLAFCGHSQRWGGGVATIVHEPGARVVGLLYRLSEEDLEKLNGFEGYPDVYKHLPVRVIAHKGRVYPAMTYQKRETGARPPSLRYFHQIWQAYQEWGLDERGLLAAVEESLNGKAARL